MRRDSNEEYDLYAIRKAAIRAAGVGSSRANSIDAAMDRLRAWLCARSGLPSVGLPELYRMCGWCAGGFQPYLYDQTHDDVPLSRRWHEGNRNTVYRHLRALRFVAEQIDDAARRDEMRACAQRELDFGICQTLREAAYYNRNEPRA